MMDETQASLGKIETQSLPQETWIACGDLFVEHLFKKSGQLILDCDGVIFQSNSLDNPQFTTPDLVRTLCAFETTGRTIGLATARNDRSVSYLRSFGLDINGPLILEGGHVEVLDGIRTVFATEEYRMFIRHLRKTMMEKPYYQQTWKNVIEFTRANNKTFVCLGNKQWNGDYRATFWYYWQGETSLGMADEAVRQTVVPHIVMCASTIGLTPGDFDVKLSRMDNGLGIIRIANKIDGFVVSKEMAAQNIWNGNHVVYVADGEDDRGLEFDIQSSHGNVIALGGSHDMTPDVPAFIQHADMRLRDPSEFVKALEYAIDIWSRRFQ